MIDIFSQRTIEVIINASITGLGTAIGSSVGTYLMTRYILRHPDFLAKFQKKGNRKS